MGACLCSGSKHQDGLAGEEETCTLVRRPEHRSSDRVRGQGNVQGPMDVGMFLQVTARMCAFAGGLQPQSNLSPQMEHKCTPALNLSCLKDGL